MQRKKITPLKEITPEMLEKGRVLLSRDVFNGITSYINVDANNDFNQLNHVCEKFENEHKVALNNLDVSIVNLINAIQNQTQSIEQYNITLQSIHDSFKVYLTDRITAVPQFIDNEQQIQLIINRFDETTSQNMKEQDSHEIFDTFRQVLISRLELASQNKNLHAQSSNWLGRNTESAKNIWGNINEFNELIAKRLSSNNLVIIRRQELQELLIKLNSNLEIPQNPSQEELKDQDPPPPYSEQIEPHYPSSPYVPVQYGVQVSINQGVLQQEYEPVEGIPPPSAPPLDVDGIKSIQITDKNQTSSQLVLSRLKNSEALVGNAGSVNNDANDQAKKVFSIIKKNLAEQIISTRSHITITTDKTRSEIIKHYFAVFTMALQELESFTLPNEYNPTYLVAIYKKIQEFNAPAQDNAARNAILNELLGIIAILKADVMRLQQATEKSNLSTIDALTSISNLQPNINVVSSSHGALSSFDASLLPSAPSFPENEQIKFGNIVIPPLNILRKAERKLVNYLINRNTREIINMVGFRNDIKMLTGIEAMILLCEKNNLAYHIKDNPGTALDTKYSSHQDPSIKSIFAYLDQHFKPIVKQLSQDVLATVVLVSDEKEEVKLSLSEKGKNIKVLPKPVLSAGASLPLSSPKPALVTKVKELPHEDEKTSHARAMQSLEERLNQPFVLPKVPTPVYVAKHRREARKLSPEERRQMLFNLPAKATLIQQAEVAKKAYLEGCNEEKHYWNMEAEFNKNPSTFPVRSYFHAANRQKVINDRNELVARNAANLEEYRNLKIQIEEAYEHKIPTLTAIDTNYEEPSAACCSIM